MQREIDDEVNIKATDVSSVVRTPLVDKPSSVRARYRRFYRLIDDHRRLVVVSAF